MALSERESKGLRGLIADKIRDGGDFEDMDWVIDWVRDNLPIDGVFRQRDIDQVCKEWAEENGYREVDVSRS